MVKIISMILFIAGYHLDAKAQTLSSSVNFTGAVDILAPFYLNNTSTKNSELQLRSTELQFYSSIDQTFDGNLNIAVHQHEEGEYELEIHEAYFKTSQLIDQSRIKVGKFFIDLGRLNTAHQHDWAMIYATAINQEMFGSEGIADTGLEYTWLVPTDFFFELTAGITSGKTSHEEEITKTPRPMSYLHSKFFFPKDNGGTLLGFNYFDNKRSTDIHQSALGLDLTYKTREGKILKYMLQSELWYHHQKDKKDDLKYWGGYIFPQFSLTERSMLGIVLSFMEKKHHYAVTPTYTFKNSEFFHTKIAYAFESNNESKRKNDQSITAQFVYVIGAHPSHDF